MSRRLDSVFHDIKKETSLQKLLYLLNNIMDKDTRAHLIFWGRLFHVIDAPLIKSWSKIIQSNLRSKTVSSKKLELIKEIMVLCIRIWAELQRRSVNGDKEWHGMLEEMETLLTLVFETLLSRYQKMVFDEQSSHDILPIVNEIIKIGYPFHLGKYPAIPSDFGFSRSFRKRAKKQQDEMWKSMIDSAMGH